MQLAHSQRAEPPTEEVERPARPTPIRREASVRGPSHWPDRIVAVLLLSGCAVATAIHLPYYLGSPGTRLRDPLHALLRPSGPVGIGFGIAAFVLFAFVWLYPLRKRFPGALGWTGRVPTWLRSHVVAGFSLPALAAVHAGWRFDGLIGLGYWSMLVVWASGLMGRYLYAHIPRSKNGIELSLEEVRAERRTLLTRLAIETGIEPLAVERALTLKDRRGRGVLGALRGLVLDDIDRRVALGRLARTWSRRPGGRPLDRAALGRALALARREMALDKQMHALENTRRLFALWHVAHRPFAITALVAVVLHVAVAVWLGAVSFQ
jgi:hypothetical protein